LKACDRSGVIAGQFIFLHAADRRDLPVSDGWLVGCSVLPDQSALRPHFRLPAALPAAAGEIGRLPDWTEAQRA
jgi:hypothetical protein